MDGNTFTNLPRGIRNHNPGNIDRRDGVEWMGLAKEQTDPRFCTFTTPVFGLRAVMKILRSYEVRHDLTNVLEIINRWAPPVENNTDAYVSAVAKFLGVAPTAVLPKLDRTTIINLTKAIVIHENGHPPAGQPACWYDDLTYAEAANLALG